MSKINVKGAYTEAQNVAPVNPSTYETLTRDFDFMTNPKFEPSDYSFLNKRHDGIHPEDMDGYYRVLVENYIKRSSQKFVEGTQGLPFKPFYDSIPSSLSNFITWNWPQVVIKDVPEKYPDITTAFYDRPLGMVGVRYRVPIKESLKLNSFHEMESFYPPTLNEQTGQMVNNPFMNQFNSDREKMNLYFDINQKSLTDVLTEEEEEMLSESKVGFESALTNENYYIDLWNDASLYDKHFTSEMGSSFDWSTTPYLVPTSPNEVLPNLVDIRFLSYVNRKRDFPETGEVGDVIVYRNDDYQNPEQSYYAWDPINEKWSQQVFDLFIEPTYVRQRVLIDSKIKNHKDLCLTLTPFTLVANYLPSFRIKKDLI